MNSETKAYQHARSVWERFHARSKCLVLDEESLSSRAVAENILYRILRALPPVERAPMAIGLFVRFSRNWGTSKKSGFLEEFLPSPSPIVSDLLNAAAKWQVSYPLRFPVTLEEFPSRIWHRALASRSPKSLVSAAYLAFNAMVRLIELHKDDADPKKPMTFWFPSVDLPSLIDLVALPQEEGDEYLYLKDRVLSHVYGPPLDGRFIVTPMDVDTIHAWIVANSVEGPPLLEKLVAETVATVEDRDENGELCDPCHTRRLGCLMFRFGKRRLAYQCAKAIGHSPRAFGYSLWEMGWQFQVVSADFHSRIRKIILGRKSDSTAWLEEPALACSTMTIPLWLVDGIARVDELAALFNRAEECPWIFPRLQRIYQWHLAIASKHESLREIEQSNPNLAIGLSRKLIRFG